MKLKRINRPFEVKSINDDGAFTGYASVFGELDHYNDIVMPGAFTKSLKRSRKGKVPVLWMHNDYEPIGVHTTIEEDKTGLYIEGQLILGVQRATEAHLLMKAGAVSGISIGYIPIEVDYNTQTDVRKLTEVDLWENSIVTFPALDSARVDEVKSLMGVVTLSDCESYLRDEGGFSIKEAKTIISKIKKAATANPRDADVSADEIKAAIQLLRSK